MNVQGTLRGQHPYKGRDFAAGQRRGQSSPRPPDGIHLLFFLLPATVVVRRSRLSKVSRSREVFPQLLPNSQAPGCHPVFPLPVPMSPDQKGFLGTEGTEPLHPSPYKPAGCLRRNRKRSWDLSASEVGRTSSHRLRGLLEAEKRPGGNPLEQSLRSQREKVSAAQG